VWHWHVQGTRSSSGQKLKDDSQLIEIKIAFPPIHARPSSVSFRGSKAHGPKPRLGDTGAHEQHHCCFP
jgi:hypothetical protein